MEADIVTVLYVCPQANTEFRERVTSPYLAGIFPDKGALEIWKKLVSQDKFISVSMEDLLDTITHQAQGVNRDWADYLQERYGSGRLTLA